jgi:hypothetical protein
LPYDAAIMTGFRVPTARFAAIEAGVLILHGSKTDARLKQAAAAVAKVVRGAEHRELSGQSHNVSAAALAPVVIEFVGA